MTTSRNVLRLLCGSTLFLAAIVTSAAAQVTPAAGYVPPDDTPAIRVGVTIFADYTVQDQPKTKDLDNNDVTFNAFNLGRAYINVTGNISHVIAFRVTPDIVRETGTNALNGSYALRIKYAYMQFNLDDWMARGSWARLGVQQTPWVDFEETVYRYRFQGTIFADREGYLSSSDVGGSFHYNLPGNYGDIHGGFYNGETYTKPELNDQKAFMVRGTFRPLRMHPVLRGMRLTGFYDHDAYVKNAERRRAVGAVTFEHPKLNAAFSYLSVTDQTRAALPEVDGSGFSFWATPRTAKGWEGLIRYDQLSPNHGDDSKKKRTLGGIAFWFPHQGTVSTALLFDVEQVNYDNFAPTPARPTERRFALHGLVNF